MMNRIHKMNDEGKDEWEEKGEEEKNQSRKFFFLEKVESSMVIIYLFLI